MAIEEEQLENSEELEAGAKGEEGGKKSKKKKILIILFVLLAIGAGVYFFVLEEEEPLTDKEKAALIKQERKEIVESGQRGIRIQLEPMVANLNGLDRYLRVQLTVELWDVMEDPEHEKMQVEIRDVLLTIFSEKTAEELIQAGARRNLKEELIATLNQYYGKEDPIRDIFFQEFIVQ